MTMTMTTRTADSDDGGDDPSEAENVVDAEAEALDEHAELPAGVADVNGEQETVNPGAAEDAAPPGRS